MTGETAGRHSVYGPKILLTIFCTALLLALAHSAGGAFTRTIIVHAESPAEDTNEDLIIANPWNNYPLPSREVSVASVRIPVDNPEVIAEIRRVFGSAANRAIQIARCESGLRPDALNDNPRTRDYSVGVFQINLYGNLSKTRPSEEWLKNYQNNISYAHEMYLRSGFGPWTCSRI